MAEGVVSGSVQTQINGLSARLDKGFEELKAMLQRFDDRVRGVENGAASCRPFVNEKLDQTRQELSQVRKQVEDNEDRISALERSMEKTLGAVRILSYVGGAFLMSVVALIWALITGQAEVIFR